jgi:signal transduction histidine kinase/ligand-binding sensor domain-containing protein
MAAACLRGVPAAADDVPSLLNDFRIASWTGGDGITLGQVRAIVQDKSGYLWLASEAGLVRFDGFRFATTDIVLGATKLPASPTKAVYLARDGSLWVGFESRFGLYRIADGEVRSVHLAGEITGFVNAITEDTSGALWVGHDGGIHRLRGGRWDAVPLPSSDRTTPRAHTLAAPQSPSSVIDIHEDRHGTLWVATGSGLYVRKTPSSPFEPTAQTGVVRALSEDAEGRVWATDDVGGFRRAGTSDHDHLVDLRGMSLFHDHVDNLWVATIGQGLWKIRHGRDRPAIAGRATAQTGLLSDETSAFLEDREGNIWAGSNQGLHRLTPHKVRSLIDLGIVRAVTATPDGAVWAGTAGGLIGLSDQARTGGEISHDSVRALHTSSDGTVWVATESGLGHVADRRVMPVSYAGPSLQRVTSMTSDGSGALWLCDEVEGLVRLARQRLQHIAGAATPWGQPTLAYADHASRVWVGFADGRVRVFDRNGRLQNQYGPDQGLPHAAVHAIDHDRHGDIWIAGSRGLSLLKGERFETLTDRTGLAGRAVISVSSDDIGDLWLAVNAVGIVRFARNDIAPPPGVAPDSVRYQVYTPADGAAGLPFTINSGPAARRPDGTLWFMTSRGVTIVDPRVLRKQVITSTLRPRIEGVSADDERYGPLVGLTLPPRPARVRIDYTAVNLSSSSRIRLRYRLDGFDRDWVEGTGPRQALYTNLPSGSYRFRLQAWDGSGSWNDAEAAWPFSIRPMFYETGSFYAGSALALVLLVMSAWQLQVRRVRKEIGLVFGERLRLSREIHDTLLQSLVGIALQLDSASHSVEAPAPSRREQLISLRKQVEEYIREVRQSIWDLRSPALDRHGLVGALRSTGEKLTAGKARFGFTVSGTPRPCPSKVETHALRIGHEAVMNAMRHSTARHVNMEVGFGDRTLRLCVTDDGGGFSEYSPDDHEHYGLTTMRERALDAGGRCVVESIPGAGVQVIAEFPLAPPSQA